MKRITSRFVLLLAVAGILPLLVYGAVSIYSLRDATRRSVITGNENVARIARERQSRSEVPAGDIITVKRPRRKCSSLARACPSSPVGNHEAPLRGPLSFATEPN